MPKILINLQKLSWRRVDVEFNNYFCHDFLIGGSPISILADPTPGKRVVSKLVQILELDQQ